MEIKQPGWYRGYVIHTVSSSTSSEPPFYAAYSVAKRMLDGSYGTRENVPYSGIFFTEDAAHEAAYTAARKHVDSLT